MHDSKHRRKSLSIFKPSLSGLAPIRDNSASPSSSESGRQSVLKKKLRPASLVSAPSSVGSPLSLQRADSNASQRSVPSPALKGRANLKASRPSSIFGSIKSISSLQSLPDDDDESSASYSTTRTSWGAGGGSGDAPSTLDPERMVLLHHGDVIVGGGMFRKRSQYLLLTNTHLIRFRSQARASELFPGLTPPSSSSGSESNTHTRKPSNSSIAEISADDASNIPIRQIVAAYKLDDGKESKSGTSLEIAYLDDVTNFTSTLTLQLYNTKEADQWLTSLRGTVSQARAAGGLPFSRRAVEYVARVLENDGDYDPQHFHMYTVVQREKKSGSRSSSSDDLGKLLSNICYLVIGYYKMHLVPLLRPTKSSSSSSITDLTGSSYGIAALTSFSRSDADDSFQLGFRLPLQAPTSLYFASSSSDEIASSIRGSLEHLRPLYAEQPLLWSPEVDSSKPPSPAPTEIEDHLGFDRTLTAYCIAYKLDPSNIRYTVSYFGEDTPEFQLLEPANAALRPNYNALEILSILRALRYNDSFNSLSFRGVKLDALHGLVDRFGWEHLCWKTKTGQALDRPHANRLTLLIQEMQNIAVQNERLRRVDFTDALSQSRADARYTERSSTEVVEALMPLCSQRLTNIDWIVLNGLALSEVDVSCLYAATLKRSCEFRAVELGGCALSFEGLRVVAEGMQYQAKTIECINISGCATRLDENFIASLASFTHLRSLDLSKCQPAVGNGALLPYNILKNWRLESLKLSGTPLTQSSVDDLGAYLMDNQSGNIRELLLDCCQVNGREIAVILQSLSQGRDEPRKMILDVSKNRIAQDQYAKILGRVKASETPEQLIMRFLEYSREEDFGDLLEAVTKNKSLKYLDISSVSLPFDAGEETCDALQNMFENNVTLEELNISGETAALEAATIGKGLPRALRGLASNKTLRVLHCRHQALGLPGAAALAYVLERNENLLELHCEDNEISLQAFTALINGLESNETLLYLPPMQSDRMYMTEKVNREVNAILSHSGTAANSGSSSSSRTGLSLRRTVSGFSSSRPGASSRSSSSRSLSRASKFRVAGTGNSAQEGPSSTSSNTGYTEQDLAAAVTKLDDSWEAESERMQAYLLRNAYLAQGLAPDGAVLEEVTPNVRAMKIPLTAAEAGFVLPPVAEANESSRPATAGSLAAAIAKATLDRTPTAEFDRQLGAPTKAAVDTSIVNKGLGAQDLENEGSLIDTPVQGEFGPVLHTDDDTGSVLVMGAG